MEIRTLNVSFVLFFPVRDATARYSLRTSSHIFTMSSDSFSASCLVANTVCPSTHRNSLPLRNGTGCLNSHLTTLFHCASFSGRSRQDLIHFAYESYIMVSDVGLIASRSSSFVSPA